MEKILIYLFSYLLAISVGVVIGMLIDNDDTYKVLIRKIKQRGKGNILENGLTLNLPPNSKREERKKRREERRKNRVAKRTN